MTATVITVHCEIVISPIIDYSEERVAVLLNADLADTLGNLLQRVTAKKLHSAYSRVQTESPATAVAHREQLESEWSRMSKHEADRALVDHLKHLTGWCNLD